MNFLLNTVADNTADEGAAGVHLEFFSDPLGTNVFSMSHSIIWSNSTGEGLGGAIPDPGVNFQVDVELSDVDGQTPKDYADWIGDRTGVDGNISVNPQFVSASSSDYHLQGGSGLVEVGDKAIGSIIPTDFEGSPRAIDSDSDGWFVVDWGADEVFNCGDSDADGYGTGADCSADNCDSVYNPGQSDCDTDNIGDACDLDTIDLDGDGVDAACDIDDNNPNICADLDNDSCDDCVGGFAYRRMMGSTLTMTANVMPATATTTATVPLISWTIFRSNPFRCGDADNDGCEDDCATGTYDPFSDGVDTDGDGMCDIGDPDDDNDGIDDAADSAPLDSNVCLDSDLDGCDDCSGGVFDPFNDGTDVDGDGFCAAGDSNDGDPLVCVDSDADLCDDCSSGIYDPLGDGVDTDLDGICNAGDPDDDNDGVIDGSDCAPLTVGVSAPVGDLGDTLRLGPSDTRLRWVDIPSSHVFNVYRGEVDAGVSFGYVQFCYAADVPRDGLHRSLVAHR